MVTEKKSTANQSTQLAFHLIEEMALAGHPVGVSELSRLMCVPKPRVYRFLRTLVGIGYVEQDPDTDRYALTLKLFHLGETIADNVELLVVARPIMVRLRDTTLQTVTLSQVELQGMRVLEMVRFESPVQIITRPGALLDFHSSAQGKVALAFGPENLWDTVRSQPLRLWTHATETDISVLQKEVVAVRERGWATASEQVLAGVNALSAPIFDREAKFIATVTIAGSLQVIRPEPSADLIRAVREAAKTISLGLGCTEFPA